MQESKEYNIKVYSDKINAGKRAYFFDIKPTKSGDYYLVITERKKNSKSGDSEKHRIFLYKEDINKFSLSLNKAIKHIKEQLMPDYDFTKFDKSFEKNKENDARSTDGEKKYDDDEE